MYKVVESSARIAQSQAKEISDYFDNLEKEKIQKVYDLRLIEISQYTDVIPQNLGLMPNDVFTAYLQGIKIAYIARLEAEKQVEEEKARKQLQMERYIVAAEYKSFWDREYDFSAMDESKFKACLEWLKEQKSKAEKEVAVLRESQELLAKRIDEVDKEVAKQIEQKKELDEMLKEATDEDKLAIWVSSFTFTIDTPAISKDKEQVVKDILFKANAFKQWALKQINK